MSVSVLVSMLVFACPNLQDQCQTRYVSVSVLDCCMSRPRSKESNLALLWPWRPTRQQELAHVCTLLHTFAHYNLCIAQAHCIFEHYIENVHATRQQQLVHICKAHIAHCTLKIHIAHFDIVQCTLSKHIENAYSYQTASVSVHFDNPHCTLHI